MKIIKIDTCAICPYIDWRTEGDETIWRCNYPAGVPSLIPDKETFPVWCPLEDKHDKPMTLGDQNLEKDLFENKQCPDCKGTEFLKGPCGGNSTNIKCKQCGSEFNVCPPYFAERIR